METSDDEFISDSYIVNPAQAFLSHSFFPDPVIFIPLIFPLSPVYSKGEPK